jgi:hypothetical protein
VIWRFALPVTDDDKFEVVGQSGSLVTALASNATCLFTSDASGRIVAYDLARRDPDCQLFSLALPRSLSRLLAPADPIVALAATMGERVFALTSGGSLHLRQPAGGTRAHLRVRDI